MAYSLSRAISRSSGPAQERNVSSRNFLTAASSDLSASTFPEFAIARRYVHSGANDPMHSSSAFFFPIACRLGFPSRIQAGSTFFGNDSKPVFPRRRVYRTDIGAERFRNLKPRRRWKRRKGERNSRDTRLRTSGPTRSCFSSYSPPGLRPSSTLRPRSLPSGRKPSGRRNSRPSRTCSRNARRRTSS